MAADQPQTYPRGTTDTSIVNETTPLIAAENAGVPAQAAADYVVEAAKDTDVPDRKPAGDRPLPLGQMLVLCYARMTDPIAFFTIIPFVSQMIEDTGSVAEEDVGFYVGLIEALFSFTQMCLMIGWGWGADRIGRRPVLIASNLGIALGMAAFGFSTSIWQMCVFRCFSGLFAGSIVIVRTMVSEHSTPKTQARAFSYLSVAGNLGIFIGPLIGGALSEPAKQYPNIFGGSELFKRYPYALASLVAAGCNLSSALLNFLFLKETLTKENSGAQQKPMSMLELVKQPGVKIVLFLFCYNMMIALAYTAVLPVFQFTSPGLGGYGFSPLQISIFVAIGGLSQVFWALLVFPPWQTRAGTGGVLQVLYPLYPVTMILCAVPSILRRTHHETTFWILAVVGTIGGAAMSMTFTAVQLALNDISPSPQVLSMLNAIALALVCAIRGVAPALFSSLFAIGVGQHIFGGYLAWVVMTLITCALPVCLRWVPEKAAGYGPVKSSSSDDSAEDA